MSNTLALLQEIKEKLEASQVASHADISVLSQFLVDAIDDGDKVEINAIRAKFDELIKLLMRKLLSKTVRELQMNGDSTNASEALFLNMLGELNIAQIITTRSDKKIASEEFKAILTHRSNRVYLDALKMGNLSNTELVEATGCDAAIVSRKVKELAEQGVIKHRTEGRSRINSLTPPAIRILETELYTSASSYTPKEVKDEMMSRMSGYSKCVAKPASFAPENANT